MEKEFVPYDRSLKMKDIGFDEPCLGYYAGDILCTGQPREIYLDKDGNYKKTKTESYPIVFAPTFSQAFRWFRENYDLYHVITVADLGKYESGNPNFQCAIYSKDPVLITNMDKYNTYKEAELYCLDKLIEIVESKSE
jgi:hypothetical protein